MLIFALIVMSLVPASAQDVCASALCGPDTFCVASPKQCLVAPCPQFDCVSCASLSCPDVVCPNGVPAVGVVDSHGCPLCPTCPKLVPTTAKPVICPMYMCLNPDSCPTGVFYTPVSPDGCRMCPMCNLSAPTTTTAAPVKVTTTTTAKPIIACPMFMCLDPASCPTGVFYTPYNLDGCPMCPTCNLSAPTTTTVAPVKVTTTTTKAPVKCYPLPCAMMSLELCPSQRFIVPKDANGCDLCPVCEPAVTTTTRMPVACPMFACRAPDACASEAYYTPIINGCPTCPVCNVSAVTKAPVVCPVFRCAAPVNCSSKRYITPKDVNGCDLCPVCEPIPSGAVWNPCGSACPVTCENYGMVRNFMCVDKCVPQYQCVTAGMFLYNGKCITGDQCPAATAAPADTTVPVTTDGSMPGGFSPIKDLADAALLSATNCAVGLLDAASNSLYTHSVVQIVKASRQVVAGLNYVVTVDLATTTCRVGAMAAIACTPVEGTTTRWEMHFYVGFSGQCENMASGPAFFQFGASTTDVPVETTVDDGNGGGIAGGYHAITDLADASVVAAASCAVGLIDAASRTQYRHALVQVVSGKEQVVAGLNYQLVLDIAPTACRVTAAASADCPATAGAAVTRWTIQFFVGFDGVCENPAGGPVISLGDNNNGGSVDPTSSVDQGAASSSSNSAASIGIPVGVVAGCLLVVLVVLAVMRTRNASNARVTGLEIQPHPTGMLANPTYESNPYYLSDA